MNQNRWMIRLARFTPFALLGLIPFDCASPLLKALTPVLYNDGNELLQTVITAVAPLVLP